MTWTKLLASKAVARHRTTKAELDSMRALIARDLTDAAVAGLSSDRRFATAYNAALQAANMAVACAGFRVTSSTGHHKVAFECARRALGQKAAPMLDYFEICRRKRNAIDYTLAHVATETEAAEILERAGDFVDIVEEWIARNHAALKR